MLRAPQPKDWRAFFAYTAIEGWRVPLVEQHLFRGSWQQYARVLEVDGQFCGMVTAVPYRKSGWIGNLIVPPELRGRGFGSELFAAAVKSLGERGVRSIWLTASQQGQPLYEKNGFSVVDQIERWLLPPGQKTGGETSIPSVLISRLLQADQSAWGEDRSSLLVPLAERGSIHVHGNSVAMLQKGTDLQMIGPWYADIANARQHLSRLVAAADLEQDLIIDLFRSSGLQPELRASGFRNTGRNQLMVRNGPEPASLTRMVSLASLGSIG